MINLPDLADHLNKYGIMNKSFLQMSKSEILLLVNSVFSSIDDEVPPGGWTKPAIFGGALLIDFAAHPKYHWWTTDGQSVLETLIEIDAPYEVAKKYLDWKGISCLNEEAYNNKLIPF
jgi:hypothetical protein